MNTIDLNCDMGEGTGNDSALMPFISSTNIACGFHAGDFSTISETAHLALKYEVKIGAHPSFPDKENFGRTPMNFSLREIYEMVLYQLGAVDAIVKSLGGKLHHVKPHGALYNSAAINQECSTAIVKAVRDFSPELILFGLANSVMIEAAKESGLRYKQEVFADRTYQEDGTLTPRSQPSALITEEDQCLRQVLQMVQQGTVVSVNGKQIPIHADTVCVHGDGAHAIRFVQLLNTRLRQEGINISSE